jgi:hypothetical protein
MQYVRPFALGHGDPGPLLVVYVYVGSQAASGAVNPDTIFDDSSTYDCEA